MAKEKEQKEALVRTVKIPVEVTVVSTGNETSVLLRAQVTDDVGRVWDSNSYGKGKDLKTALGDFHAEIARNPIKFSTLVERAVKGTGPIESSPVDANRTIQLSSTQESEILISGIRKLLPADKLETVIKIMPVAGEENENGPDN